MVITYQGGNYFRIQSGDYTILIDPENQRSFKGAQVVINTVKPAFAEQAEGDDAPIWIENQGEYEVGGVRILGYSTGWNAGAKCETTAYRIIFDEISIAIFGHLYSEMDSKIVSELSGADIVIAPGAGKPFLNESSVAKLIRQIEPGIIIPTLTENPKPLFKELGRSDVVAEERLVIKKKDIQEKAMKAVWLKV